MAAIQKKGKTVLASDLATAVDVHHPANVSAQDWYDISITIAAHTHKRAK